MSKAQRIQEGDAILRSIFSKSEEPVLMAA